MSCPYLEKGKIARCHAFAGTGLKLNERETDCFSGEFSECSLLFARALRGSAYSDRMEIQRKASAPKYPIDPIH